MFTQPTSNEIVRVLLKMNPNKSPGPDGFTSLFYKAAWSVIGKEKVEAISHTFSTAVLPDSTNSTILTIVPKKSKSSLVSNYRTISCCNSLYKAISKLFVHKLKLMLPNIISPNQTAFVKGCLLVENILLASELVHGYQRDKGPKKITLKVDIAKAFNTVRWKFLFSILRGMNVPELLVRWLTACICTPFFLVAYNGNVLGYFKRKRGLRQGDRLSPHLFVLTMNCLSLMLNK